MRQQTYERIRNLCKEKNGYVSFQQFKEENVTIQQINELTAEGKLEKVCRGWYWCNCCGLEKPVDYQFIELAKADEKAVICLESACYFHGLLAKPPEVVRVSTERTDRKQFKMNFPVSRHYLARKGYEDEVIKVETPFGSYQVFERERTVCDCLRLLETVPLESRLEMLVNYREFSDRDEERLLMYGRSLKAGGLMQMTLESFRK